MLKGGGGGGEIWVQFQRLKEFIGRLLKDSRVFGRFEYLVGYCGEFYIKFGLY